MGLHVMTVARREGGEEESDEEEQQREDQQKQEIEDRTQTNLVNLRRTIYLTIMSSLDFEEVRGLCNKPICPA